MRLIHAITTAQVKYLTMISMVSKRQELKKNLDAALTSPHAWDGKRCNVHIDLKIDGTLQNFIIKGGDKDYCHALAEAAKRAKFPAFTDQHVYDVMGSARWDLHGQP